MISGGESNDEVLDDEVGGCSIVCDEPMRGTATAGEGGGIEGELEGAANAAGEGVLDLDLERDLDIDLVLPWSTAPEVLLNTT
jgi:hypothetical protein